METRGGGRLVFKYFMIWYEGNTGNTTYLSKKCNQCLLLRDWDNNNNTSWGHYHSLVDDVERRWDNNNNTPWGCYHCLVDDVERRWDNNNNTPWGYYHCLVDVVGRGWGDYNNNNPGDIIIVQSMLFGEDKVTTTQTTITPGDITILYKMLFGEDEV